MDGSISVAAGILLPIIGHYLCAPGGLVCEVSEYVFRGFVAPIAFIQTLTIAPNATATGGGLGVSGRGALSNYLVAAFAVAGNALYWFLAGASFCAIWRAVRQILRPAS